MSVLTPQQVDAINTANRILDEADLEPTLDVGGTNPPPKKDQKAVLMGSATGTIGANIYTYV